MQFKKKNLISLSVAFAFLVLGITGLLEYLYQHNKATNIAHTVLGLTFLVFAIFHIKNNWSSLMGYSVTKSKEEKAGGYSKELLWSGAVIAIFTIGSYLKLPPFTEVEELGDEIRNFSKPKEDEKRLMYKILDVNSEAKGTSISIDFRKGKEAKMPHLAIWVVDSTGKLIENLFVNSKIASAKDEEAIREGEITISDLAGQEATIFPTWASKGNLKANYDKGLPRENFIIESHTEKPLVGTNQIFVEVNNQGKTATYSASFKAVSGNVFLLNTTGDTGLAERILVEIK